MRPGRFGPASTLALLLFVAPLYAAALRAQPAPAETARRVDAAFGKALDPKATLPPLVDDETFLRRVTLDLTGKLPTREQARAFEGDRARLVNQLLASE